MASGTTRWLRGIGGASSFGWIVVGQAGTMLASTSGTAWRAVNSGTTEDLEAANYLMGFAGTSKGLPFAYGWASFIAVGADGTEVGINYSYQQALGDPPRVFTPSASRVQRNGSLPKGIRFRQLLFGLNGRMLAVGEDGSVYSNYALGTAKTLMVRAVGPGLAAFGVSDAVPDPAVFVYSAPGYRAYQGGNDDWGVRDFSYVETSAAALRATETGMGAFPLVDGSKDAAVLVSVGPGVYTAMAVQKAGTPAGTVLLELCDVTY